MYELHWEAEAVDELRALPGHHRARVWKEAGAWLRSNPTTPNRRRKMIQGLKPPWSDMFLEFWQLRVDPYRVFYDVDERSRIVVIRAVRIKPHGKTTKEIL